MQILPIVEGEGDEAAVPALIRRITDAQKRFDVTVSRAHRRGDLPKVLRRFDDYLQAALLEESAILWVLDYDCAECHDHVKHTKELKARSRAIAGQRPVEFVFMVQEYETLFLADEETTRQVFSDIAPTLKFPANPELIRGAKEWLSEARPKGSNYKPMQHQARLSAQVDLERLRRRSPSFVRFEAAVLKLIDASI
jgi:Domain of unknown function (DUF4276)